MLVSVVSMVKFAVSYSQYSLITLIPVRNNAAVTDMLPNEYL
jgi:hypothetical protein